MDKQIGQAVGGPSILPCGWCYAKLPRDELESMDGDLLCRPCFEQVKRRRAREAGTAPAEPSGTRRKEKGELTLRDIPRSRAQLSEAEQERDRIRNRLIQLEHELRRKPKDVEVLSEIGDLYEASGDEEQAALYRREIYTLDPSHPSLRGKIIAEQPKMAKAPATGLPFWEDIPGILAFPLQGRGLPMVLVGGILFGFAMWIARYSLFGWAFMGLLGGYLWSYWFSVISSAASGVQEPPEWPEFFDIWHSIVWPAVAAFCCTVIAFGPALGLGLLILVSPLTFNIITGLMLVGLGFAGAITMPMVLLTYALFNSIGAAANYKFVYGSILKILPDYILFIAASCVLWAMHLAVGIAITGAITFFLPVPVLGSLLLSLLTSIALLYFNIAAYRLLGHLYHQSQGRLGWFEQRTEPEKSLNPLIVLAGLLGAGVVSVAGLAAILIIPGLLRSAAGLGELPLQGGTYLEYSEFDSDWGWSGLRYDIEEVPEGFRFTGEHLEARPRNPIPEFVVNSRGEFQNGTTDLLSGPIFSSLVRPGARKQTIFVGPTKGWVGGPHVNGYTITDKMKWKGWDIMKVDDKDTFTKLLYDRETGYLVGVLAQGLGRDLWVVLTDTNVPGLRIPEEALER